MDNQELQFYEGAVLPKPKIQCLLHQSEITSGCMVKECQHPFNCDQCTGHQHDQQDPSASLKNIDQYIFEISQKVKSIQSPFKSIYNSIQKNYSDNLNQIKWQADLDPHFKNIDNYINAQKILINNDFILICKNVQDLLDSQKSQIYKKLDECLLNYKIQYSDLKQFHDHLFQLLKNKFKYLGDSNSLSAKLNSLDAKLSQEFIIELRESISESENLLKNSGLNIVDIEKIFKEMNTLSTNLPNYKQLVDFEVIPQIEGQNAIKIFEQIKVQIESHFKEACVNLFLPPQKLTIPQNQMPKKKAINFLLSHGENSNGNMCPEPIQINNDKITSSCSSNSQPNVSNDSKNSDSYQNKSDNLTPSFFSFGESQNKINIGGLGHTKVKQQKIFSKENLARAANIVYSPNNAFQNQNNQVNQLQSPGTIFNSKYLKLKKEFKIQLPYIPKIICYLTNGYLVMAVQGECLRVLDTHSSTIINGDTIIRDVKFLTSLKPTNEGQLSSDQPNILNFALSNNSSEILLFYFNTKTRKIVQKSSLIRGIPSPVTRMVDLYSITQLPLLAAGNENGRVSIFDYDKTNGYDLDKYHSNSITQLLVISQNNINGTYLQSQLNNQTSKLISFSLEDQLVVIYSYNNNINKFQKQFIFNVSDFGSGVLQLKNHLEFEQFIAICKDFSTRILKIENQMITDQNVNQSAKDLAVFSVKDSQIRHNENIRQQDSNLLGLIFTSEQASDKVVLLKATKSSSIIQKEQTFQSIYSNRKILYVDNSYKLFILINDENNYIYIYDIKS